MSRPLRILSLGAGVQSSTVFLMSLKGELPRLDHAIFADTGWEPAPVYEQLAFLEREAERAGVPLHRVSAGNIRDAALSSLAGETRSASLPMHLTNPDGRPGMLRRQCTSEFKIEPITRKIRELLGVGKSHPVKPDEDGNAIRVEQWFGISADEMQRVRYPRDRWIRNFYPLLGPLTDEPNLITGGVRMRRADCLAWLKRNGYPVAPKSACIGCPYHDNRHWREMKLHAPGEFQEAVEFDREIRHGLRGVDCAAYLHRSMQPLDEVDLSTAEDNGQTTFDALGFDNECEGMCGL